MTPRPHRIVDAHHGVITIDSRPGEGTTAELRLPVVRDWNEETA